MKKDAYYFPHFCNARNDSKIVKIRRVLGLEGYAIYFMLLEILREQTEFKYPISGVEDLAYEWHTSKEKILNVIYDYELFKIDTETNFFSTKLVLYLQPYLEKSARASVAANTRWEKVKLELESNANAMQMHNNSNANDMQVKEIKVKEIKVKEIKVKEESEIFTNFINSFNLIAGKKFRVPTDKFKKQFEQRLKEGFNIEEILKAAENCSKDHYHIQNPQHLTPEFITRPDKLEKYLNAPKQPINGFNQAPENDLTKGAYINGIYVLSSRMTANDRAKLEQQRIHENIANRIKQSSYGNQQ